MPTTTILTAAAPIESRRRARLSPLVGIGAGAALIAGVAVGLVPWPALIGLATIPLALQVARGLREHYDRPYEVMPFFAMRSCICLNCSML